MTMIRWRMDTADTPPRTFALDETKSWKGALIRGHDIAEMIAYEVYAAEALTLRKVYILQPPPFVGEYDITPVFQPEFTAKLVGQEAPASKPKPKKKH